MVARPLAGDREVAFPRSCSPLLGGWAQPRQMDEKIKKGGHSLEATEKLQGEGGGALTLSSLCPPAPQFPPLGPGSFQGPLVIHLFDAPEASVGQLCWEGCRELPEDTGDHPGW